MSTSELISAILKAHAGDLDTTVGELLSVAEGTTTEITATYKDYKWDILATINGDSPQIVVIGQI